MFQNEHKQHLNELVNKQLKWTLDFDKFVRTQRVSRSSVTTSMDSNSNGTCPKMVGILSIISSGDVFTIWGVSNRKCVIGYLSYKGVTEHAAPSFPLQKVRGQVIQGVDKVLIMLWHLTLYSLCVNWSPQDYLRRSPCCGIFAPVVCMWTQCLVLDEMLIMLCICVPTGSAWTGHPRASWDADHAVPSVLLQEVRELVVQGLDEMLTMLRHLCSCRECVNWLSKC